MLKKIEITNFKNFGEKFTFDLSDTSNFEFNKDCIKNGIVNKGLIYGYNACGKSNLGLAIFDLISHLTDKYLSKAKYNNYISANSFEEEVRFKFVFAFGNNIVEYEYTKYDVQTLIFEKLIINDKIFASVDRGESTIFTTSAKGAESLNKDLKDSKLSVISYIEKNTILEDTIENNIFKQFKDFINNMLFSKALDERFYIGYEEGEHILSDDIVKKGNLKEFEKFLNDAGLEYSLRSKKISGVYQIFFKFDKREIEFFEAASSGTKALCIFYFWYQRMKSDKTPSFLFIDEFDAFYHHDLSVLIIEKLKEIKNVQVILTTHNTSNISNRILRPDCYFIMDNKKISSLKDRTYKELREAHNIEKMYKAGSFE
ncbi:MAG: SMC domain protein [uncultured Campylobacterales bacterium]|uniref:SMC domain protein n=1 Tax=uncultured Campylobacterales bacterium TaxID=352960 RepID=A0A6S6RWB3_9BACT|nr:MAG: SMC domain protein [uncultured Campylobacterales bacterium]